MMFTLRSSIFVAISLSTGLDLLPAQEEPAGKYSPEIVAKAEQILADLDLRRSGRSIQSTATIEISRAISGLTRKKRELRLLNQDWQQVADQIRAIANQLKQLNSQYGELNLRLSQVAGVDTAANNRIVGLINATTAKIMALRDQRKQLQEELTTKRASLNQAEADYAESVLAIRRELDGVRGRVEQAVADQQAKIAFRVLQQTYQTPEEPTAETILRSLEQRVDRIEQQIFSESIKLDVQRGSLYVDVVVGKKSTPMVVDSGATLVSLPPNTASELGLDVPDDAPRLRLRLADGRSIEARAVTIPKVRVGQFEADNVAAAVLDDSANQAEPLLGMSFLGNFKFEIDAGDQTLKLLRVATE